jgi:hypothetical protein
MLNPQQKAACTSTYEDMLDKGILSALVSYHQYKYGGDREDLASDVNEQYIKAYLSYDPSKGPFESRLRFCVSHALLEQVRKTSYRQARLHRIEYELDDIPVNDSSQRIADIMADMNEDARSVIRLVFEPPAGIFKPLDKKRGPIEAYHLRNCFRSYLLGQGWTMARISQAFRQIMEALRP